MDSLLRLRTVAISWFSIRVFPMLLQGDSNFRAGCPTVQNCGAVYCKRNEAKSLCPFAVAWRAWFRSSMQSHRVVRPQPELLRAIE